MEQKFEKMSAFVTQARKKLLNSTLKYVKIPNLDHPRRFADETILNNLKRMGVSTQSEIEVLRLRVERLEEELAKLTSSRPAQASSAPATEAPAKSKKTKSHESAIRKSLEKPVTKSSLATE